MELRQLRYLVALGETLHFTRAAARLHIAQPALSQQIRRLEAEVGVPLVDRTTRHVALTPAGETLVARARRVLAEVEAAEAELADLAGLRTGRVAIGAMRSTGPYDLGATIASFARRYPGVELAVHEESSEVMLEDVRADVLDLAFLSVVGLPLDGDIEAHELLSEPLVAFLPPDHPLAGRAAIELAELRTERFVAFGEGSSLRRILLEGARLAGYEPHIALASNESGRIRAMVSIGLGVAVLPISDADRGGPPVAVARVEGPPLARDVTVAWRAGRRHSPAARAFFALATG